MESNKIWALLHCLLKLPAHEIVENATISTRVVTKKTWATTVSMLLQVPRCCNQRSFGEQHWPWLKQQRARRTEMVAAKDQEPSRWKLLCVVVDGSRRHMVYRYIKGFLRLRILSSFILL